MRCASAKRSITPHGAMTSSFESGADQRVTLLIAKATATIVWAIPTPVWLKLDFYLRTQLNHTVGWNVEVIYCCASITGHRGEQALAPMCHVAFD